MKSMCYFYQLARVTVALKLLNLVFKHNYSTFLGEFEMLF